MNEKEFLTFLDSSIAAFVDKIISDCDTYTISGRAVKNNSEALYRYIEHIIKVRLEQL